LSPARIQKRSISCPARSQKRPISCPARSQEWSISSPARSQKRSTSFPVRSQKRSTSFPVRSQMRAAHPVSSYRQICRNPVARRSSSPRKEISPNKTFSSGLIDVRQTAPIITPPIQTSIQFCVSPSHLSLPKVTYLDNI